MTDHERRLRRLEARIPADPTLGPVPMIEIAKLSLVDQEQLRAALDAGDTATVDRYFEKHTGQRPRTGEPANSIIIDIHPACRGGDAGSGRDRPGRAPPGPAGSDLGRTHQRGPERSSPAWRPL